MHLSQRSGGCMLAGPACPLAHSPCDVPFLCFPVDIHFRQGFPSPSLAAATQCPAGQTLLLDLFSFPPTTAQALLAMRHRSAELRIDGGDWIALPAMAMVAAGNGRFFGGGMQVLGAGGIPAKSDVCMPELKCGRTRRAQQGQPQEMACGEPHSPTCADGRWAHVCQNPNSSAGLPCKTTAIPPPEPHTLWQIAPGADLRSGRLQVGWVCSVALHAGSGPKQHH